MWQDLLTEGLLLVRWAVSLERERRLCGGSSGLPSIGPGVQQACLSSGHPPCPALLRRVVMTSQGTRRKPQGSKPRRPSDEDEPGGIVLKATQVCRAGVQLQMASGFSSPLRP